MSKGKRMASRAEMKENKRKRRQAKKAGKMLRANNKRNRRYEPRTSIHNKQRSRSKIATPNHHQQKRSKRATSNYQQQNQSRGVTPNHNQQNRNKRTTTSTKNRHNAGKSVYGYSYYQQRNKKRKINKFRVFIALIILIAIIATPIYLIMKNKDPKETTVSSQESPEAEQSSQPTQEPSSEPSPEATATQEGQATMEGIVGVEDEQIKELIQKTMAEEGLTENNFAFFYYNINQETYYFYNENKYMTGASMVKMPVAMVYYDMLKRGEITLEDTIKYQKDSYEPGAGATASMYKVGESVPIKYLLEQSIINSDNTANNILISKLGYEEYRRAVAEYATIDLPDEFYEKNIMSSRYAYDVCKHLYDNMQDYQGLIEYLKKSSNGSYLKKYLTNTDVAHKYGSYENCEHDYGIVFGKNTYLIGVLTDGVKNSEELISKISLDVFNTEES